MTLDNPQDQQLQPHHRQQEPQQDFKQQLEAFYSQSKSWFDRQNQNLDNFEAHQHDLNQANLESIANIKANLQLTRSDVDFLRRNVRAQDERIEELRTLIEKSKQLSTAQRETITHLQQERTSLRASNRTLHQRAEKLEADLEATILRVDTLECHLSRIKRNIREHKVTPGRNSVTTVAEEDRRTQDIQRILSTIHGYEAVHAHALELLPPPSSDPLQGPSSQNPSFRNQEVTTIPFSFSPPSLPSPHAQPTIYFIADTPRDKPTPAPTSSSSTTPALPFALTPTTSNTANPIFLTTSPPPPPSPPTALSIAATTTTTIAAAGNTPNETVTSASDIETSPFQLFRAQHPSPPPYPQFSSEKFLKLQRVQQQLEDYKAWTNQQTEQSQFLFQPFPHQDKVQDQRFRISHNPFATSPQYALVPVSFALSLAVSFLAYITIQIYSILFQPNQQYSYMEDLVTVCEFTYNTNSVSWMPMEGEAFIPT